MTAETIDPQAIWELLHRQDVLFGRLEDLGTRQRQLVTDDCMEPLLHVLADRQRLSAELTRLTHDLAPARRDWRQTRLSFAAPQREEADRLINVAGHRLRRLMDQDEEDARKLSIRKQAVVQTLGAAGSAQHALNAYRAGGERIPQLDCTEGGR